MQDENKVITFTKVEVKEDIANQHAGVEPRPENPCIFCLCVTRRVLGNHLLWKCGYLSESPVRIVSLSAAVVCHSFVRQRFLLRSIIME